MIEIRPNTLGSQLVYNQSYDRLCETQNCIICFNGRKDDWISLSMVQLISTKAYENDYIGETDILVGVRINEHLIENVKVKQKPH